MTPVPYSFDLWRSIVDLNKGINETIRYEPSDRWRFALDTNTGDCKTYVMSKVEQFALAGVPFSAMSVSTVCVLEAQPRPEVLVLMWGAPENHAVLRVELDTGVFVCDSRFNGQPYPWDKVPPSLGTYLWMKGKEPGGWRDLRADNPQAAGLELTPFPPT